MICKLKRTPNQLTLLAAAWACFSLKAVLCLFSSQHSPAPRFPPELVPQSNTSADILEAMMKGGTSDHHQFGIPVSAENLLQGESDLW